MVMGMRCAGGGTCAAGGACGGDCGVAGEPGREDGLRRLAGGGEGSGGVDEQFCSWKVTDDFHMKRRLQNGFVQAYGFSPVCLRECTLRLAFLLKWREQTGQTYVGGFMVGEFMVAGGSRVGLRDGGDRGQARAAAELRGCVTYTWYWSVVSEFDGYDFVV